MRLATLKELFSERVSQTFRHRLCLYLHILYCFVVFHEAQGHTFIHTSLYMNIL